MFAINALPAESVAAEAVCSGATSVGATGATSVGATGASSVGANGATSPLSEGETLQVVQEDDYTEEYYSDQGDYDEGNSEDYSSSSSSSTSSSSSQSALENYLPASLGRRGRVSSQPLPSRSLSSRPQPSRPLPSRPVSSRRQPTRYPSSHLPFLRLSRFSSLGADRKEGRQRGRTANRESKNMKDKTRERETTSRLSDRAEEILKIRPGLVLEKRPRNGKTPAKENPRLHNWSAWQGTISTTAAPRRGRLLGTTSSLRSNNSCSWDPVKGGCRTANTTVSLFIQDQEVAAGPPYTVALHTFPSLSLRSQIVGQVFPNRQPRNEAVFSTIQKVTTDTASPKSERKFEKIKSGRKDVRRGGRSEVFKARGSTQKCQRNGLGKCAPQTRAKNLKVKTTTPTPSQPFSIRPSKKDILIGKSKFSHLFPIREKLPQLVVDREDAEVRRRKEERDNQRNIERRKEAEKNLEAKKIRAKIKKNLAEREEKRKSHSNKITESLFVKTKLDKSKAKKQDREGKSLKSKPRRVGKALWTVEEWLRRG